ncbi:MAG: hydrogenase/urease maturation nickel metallochaperone HypA [Actinomycetota bacterium]
MHEVSLVAELVAECERRAVGQPIESVRVRYASSIPEAGLRQAFSALTATGCAAGATLEAEMFDVHLACPCGFDGVLGHDDLVTTSVAVCPECGDVSTLHRTADLELVEVQLTA